MESPTGFAGASLPDGTIPDPELRAKLASSHVAVLGCGGLGSNAAMMLVRSGIGRLTLADFDKVSEDNLNRQMFFVDQIGKPKTEALAITLRRINPDTRLELVDRRITAENLVNTVSDARVIVEAVDTVESKTMIIETCCRELPDVPLVSVSGIAGYESANSVITHRFADNLYIIGDMESDIRAGHSLLASRVMVAAAHEAHTVIRLLLGCKEM